MTQNTEQERAEFEAWWQEWGLGDYDTQFEAWQAARRAQVVPKGYKRGFQLDNKCTLIFESTNSATDWFDKFCENYDASAAPPPPEAAPVQMPDACGRVSVDEDGDSEVTWRGGFPPDDRTRLYTEHQVRQLLAAHGIK